MCSMPIRLYALYKERLSVGIYRPRYQPDVRNNPKEIAVLQDFARLLQASDTVVGILDEIQRVKFRKNFWWVVCEHQPVVLVSHSRGAQECSTWVLRHIDPVSPSGLFP